MGGFYPHNPELSRAQLFYALRYSKPFFARFTAFFKYVNQPSFFCFTSGAELFRRDRRHKKRNAINIYA